MAGPTFDAAAPPSGAARIGEQRLNETATEVLGRVAWVLDAQRIEIYVANATTMTLRTAWSAAGHADAFGVLDAPGELPLEWFPWGLGRIRPRAYLLVQNAGGLPSDPNHSAVLGDHGIASTLHLPLVDGATLRGALCAMWDTERDHWPSDRLETLGEIARSVLDRRI